MNILKTAASNGFIPIIPILLWNLLFYSRLPESYSPDVFDKDIPAFISVMEAILRITVFLFPLLIRIDLTSVKGRLGLSVFIIGLLLYFLSWLMLIYFPQASWSRNGIGFTAPAWTPLIWLIGLSFMFDSYYFNVTFSSFHFVLPSVLFTAAHFSHSAIVFFRLK